MYLMVIIRVIIINDWLHSEVPLKEHYNLIFESGFGGIRLWWRKEDGCRNNLEYARKAGLFVDNVHAPFENINSIWLDTVEGHETEKCLLRCIEDCAELEIPTIVAHLSKGRNPPPYNSLGLERFKLITEKSEKHGVNIAFENLKKTNHLSVIMEQIDSPHVGFCYDSGHHNCWTPQEDLLSLFGSRLKVLHLHDNDSINDQHLLPFDGTIDWPTTMKSIAETGYQGAIELEVDNSGIYSLSTPEFLRTALSRGKTLETLKLL